MNLDALLSKGQPPWLPNPKTAELDVWNQFDHPLTGTFSVDGQLVLFTIVAGLDTRNSVWAYTGLTNEEAKDLAGREFDSVSDLRDFVEEFFKDRKIVFALADDLLIQYWGPGDRSEGKLLAAAIDFLDGILRAIEHQADASTMLRAKLAEVDVATTELVEA